MHGCYGSLHYLLINLNKLLLSYILLIAKKYTSHKLTWLSVTNWTISGQVMDKLRMSDGTVQQSILSESEAMEEGPCGVCGCLGRIQCGNCFKVFYCCALHVNLDKEIHSKDCFPAAIRTSLTKGRYMVATRNIRAGEVVLVEKPLIVLPRIALGNQSSEYTCLGCHGSIPNSNTSIALPMKNRCSKCTWPVCNSLCQRVCQNNVFLYVQCVTIINFPFWLSQITLHAQSESLI